MKRPPSPQRHPALRVAAVVPQQPPGDAAASAAAATRVSSNEVPPRSDSGGGDAAWAVSQVGLSCAETARAESVATTRARCCVAASADSSCAVGDAASAAAAASPAVHEVTRVVVGSDGSALLDTEACAKSAFFLTLQETLEGVLCGAEGEDEGAGADGVACSEDAALRTRRRRLSEAPSPAQYLRRWYRYSGARSVDEILAAVVLLDRMLLGAAAEESSSSPPLPSQPRRFRLRRSNVLKAMLGCLAIAAPARGGCRTRAEYAAIGGVTPAQLDAIEQCVRARLGGDSSAATRVSSADVARYASAVDAARAAHLVATVAPACVEEWASLLASAAPPAAVRADYAAVAAACAEGGVTAADARTLLAQVSGLLATYGAAGDGGAEKAAALLHLTRLVPEALGARSVDGALARLGGGANAGVPAAVLAAQGFASFASATLAHAPRLWASSEAAGGGGLGWRCAAEGVTPACFAVALPRNRQRELLLASGGGGAGAGLGVREAFPAGSVLGACELLCRDGTRSGGEQGRRAASFDSPTREAACARTTAAEGGGEDFAVHALSSRLG